MVLDWGVRALGFLLVVSLLLAVAGAFAGFRSGDKTGRMLGLSPLLMIGAAVIIVPFVGGYVVSNWSGESGDVGNTWVAIGPSALSTLLIVGSGVRGAFLLRRFPFRSRRSRRPAAG